MFSRCLFVKDSPWFPSSLFSFIISLTILVSLLIFSHLPSCPTFLAPDPPLPFPPSAPDLAGKKVVVRGQWAVVAQACPPSPPLGQSSLTAALGLPCLDRALPSQTFPPLSSPHGVSCWAFSWPSLLSGQLPTGASAGNCHEELRGCLRVPGTSHQDLSVPSIRP